MGLINVTQQAYYSQAQQFTSTGVTDTYTINTNYFPTLPAVGSIAIFIGGKEINTGNYSYNSSTGVIQFIGNANNNDVITFTNSEYRPNINLIIIVKETAKAERFGGYRYISLNDIVNNFIVAYVGEGKLIPSVKRTDVVFHAKRGIQEFSYDISRIEKIQEIQLGPSLSIPVPQDYVHYVRISHVDDGGIENIIYPARYTSRPSQSILQDDDYNYLFDSNGNLLTGTPVTNTRFDIFDTDKITGGEYGVSASYDADNSLDRLMAFGGRYGLEPEIAQENGVFLIDELNGKISFSSDLADKIITLKYISDGLGTDDEMQVHKYAEEAMYKYITYAVASSRVDYPEYIINRFRKERRAAMRNAKLRLSSLKLGELTQVMKGQSKQIK
jgi:hypothetical protein